MKTPPSLQKGDQITIVSPAGKIAKEHVLPAVGWLEKEGYKVTLGKHVFKEVNTFAGTDQQRLDDLQKALNDRDTKVVICARGGYGTARIIDKLDFSAFLKNPKWVVGFSDITVLHNRITTLNIPSIHGVMPRHFLDKKGDTSKNLKSLMSILKGDKPEYIIKTNPLNITGKTSGKLAGGNLSIIYSMRGTPNDFETKGKILFLEDLGEHLYHIDRMITNLKLGGKLANLSGLVIGSFSKLKDGSSPFGKTAYEIISDAVKEYNYPVCFGFPAGHTKQNLALAFGKEWELKVDSEKSILKMM